MIFNSMGTDMMRKNYASMRTEIWGDLDVDGWIILGWNSRRWEVSICTGLGCPRIETGGGRL